jgi:ABC-2 type transport system ATP-binding protein
MNKGQKILDGSVKQIKQDFKDNLFHIGFDELPETINPTSCDIIKQEDTSLVVKIKEGFKPADVLQSFLNQDASIISFNEILPSLNEIFIKKVEDTKASRAFNNVDKE